MGDPFPQNCPSHGGSGPHYEVLIPHEKGAHLIRDSAGHSELTILDPMIHWASPSPQSKRHHDGFSRLRTDDSRVSLYFTIGRPLPRNIAFSRQGYLNPI